MAKTINLGKVGLTFEGDYDSSKNYASRTCVFYNHVSWASKKDVPAGIAPGTNEEYWQKVSERGAQGIQGERGPQGNSAFDGTGVEIVNDLIKGGEAAVLSAEQGKILKEELTKLESKIVEITDFASQIVSGRYAISNRTTGGIIQVSEVSDAAWKRAKISVKAGENYRITGTGGGANKTTETTTETDLASSMLNGYWGLSSYVVGAAATASKTWDGSWRSLQYAVKAGEKYRITGAGGVNGRLFALLTSGGVLVAVAPESYSATDYLLSVEQDGTLYCSFLKTNDFSVIKIVKNTLTENNNAMLYCVTDENGIVLAVANENESVDEKPLTISKDGFIYANFLVGNAMSLLGVSELKSKITMLEAETERLETETSKNTEDCQKVISFLGYSTTETDLASSMLNGYWKMSSYVVGAVASAEKVWDGSWKSLQYAVKAGEKYRITGTGGVNGRLFAMVTSGGIVAEIAPESYSATDYVLDIRQDGTLYCSFLAAYAYSVIKLTESFKEMNPQEWKSGSFEFGRTLDCDYTAPTIERWSYPESGQRVKAINAFYDELVSEFPQYVSKVDCDAIMASLGVAKPDAIKDAPMYMYQFLPPRTPDASTSSNSVVHRLKALVLTGTHPEYMSIWDMVNTMRLVCRNWRDDKNLEELRWNADIYIIPCLNLYGVNVGDRTNENGVDINRNAPTSDWVYQGVGGQTFGGSVPASEYATKVYMEMLKRVNPEIMIDHHATNVGSGDDEGDGKNMIYVHSTEKLAIDVGGVVISQMTRKWKDRYSDTFPTTDEDPTTIFGFSRTDDLPGSLSKYASEQGSFGSTYESNYGILYKNKQYGVANRQTNTELVATCATEGFINYLVRILKAYSEEVGVVK